MTTETKIDTGTDELLCAIRDRVAVITLNRPEVRNALSDRLTPALRTMIKTCGENPDVGALLITGAGTAFCSAATSRAWAHTATRSGSQCPMTKRSRTCRSASDCSPVRWCRCETDHRRPARRGRRRRPCDRDGL
jgi:enoyl-CoA hydratase/carnithine racemase